MINSWLIEAKSWVCIELLSFFVVSLRTFRRTTMYSDNIKSRFKALLTAEQFDNDEKSVSIRFKSCTSPICDGFQWVLVLLLLLKQGLLFLLCHSTYPQRVLFLSILPLIQQIGELERCGHILNKPWEEVRPMRRWLLWIRFQLCESRVLH